MAQSPLIRNTPPPPALIRAVELWAEARTDPASPRRADLIRDKTAALLSDGSEGHAAGFFICVRKTVESVTPLDVKTWQAYLEDMRLSESSIYSRISRLSSFYTWLMQEAGFRDVIRSNPVILARPKAPKAYQSEKTQALSDDDARKLLRQAQSEAGENIAALRDVAILRFFFATGKRRSEIINLRWGDLRFTSESMIIQTRDKGGLYRAVEIRDIGVWTALEAYLQASERWDFSSDEPLIEAEDPLWLRHDRAAQGREALTSHGFVKAFKGYAKRAGLGDLHLHQTRHTVARMVGEESGDLSEVQGVLGHQNLSTTRVYLDRISVRRDKHSRQIARRLGLEEEG